MRGIVETSFKAPSCRSSALGEAAVPSCYGTWICRLAHTQHILWRLASTPPPTLITLHEPGTWTRYLRSLTGNTALSLAISVERL